MIGDEARVYDLTFLFPDENKEFLPGICFIFSADLFSSVYDSIVLQLNDESFVRTIEEYLPEDKFFYPLQPDLFEGESFGFGKCTSICREDDQVIFKVLLLEEKWSHHACAMIKLISNALQKNRYTCAKAGEPLQMIGISNHLPVDGGSWHGHAVGGYVSKSFIAWLVAHARISFIPEVVVTAMRRTFVQTAGTKFRCLNDCNALLLADGRFILSCFGNATKLDINSSSVYGDLPDLDSVEFGSHNIDTAVQQLTLLSGLAMMCRLVKEGGFV